LVELVETHRGARSGLDELDLLAPSRREICTPQ
jgi:hypothetical protein